MNLINKILIVFLKMNKMLGLFMVLALNITILLSLVKYHNMSIEVRLMIILTIIGLCIFRELYDSMCEWIINKIDKKGDVNDER